MEDENGVLLIESEEMPPILIEAIEKMEAGEPLSAEMIEAIEWSFGSLFKKGLKYAKVASDMGLLPPGTGMGLKVLTSLAKSKKGSKVRFTPNAAANIYSISNLKGYAKGLAVARNKLARIQRELRVLQVQAQRSR